MAHRGAAEAWESDAIVFVADPPPPETLTPVTRAAFACLAELGDGGHRPY